MTFTKLKYGVIITTSVVSLTGSLVWFVNRPRIELVDIVHLTMAVQERLRATQVLTTYPSNRVRSVTNNYVVWQECSDSNAVYYTYGPWATNVIPATNGTPAITNIYEIVTTNRYVEPSGSYSQVVNVVTSLVPGTIWQQNYTYKIQDGRKYIYSGYTNYVVSGFKNQGGNVNGTYAYQSTVIGLWDKYTNTANSSYVLAIFWPAKSGAYIQGPGDNDYWHTYADPYNTAKLVSAATWRWWPWDYDAEVETGSSVVGANGVRSGYVRDASVYTRLPFYGSLMIGAYIERDLISKKNPMYSTRMSISIAVREMCGEAGGASWKFATGPLSNATDAAILLAMDKRNEELSSLRSRTHYVDQTKATAGKIDGLTSTTNFLIRGWDLWNDNNYGPTFFGNDYDIKNGTNFIGEVDMWLRFRDETTNNIEYWADYEDDYVVSPYLVKTNLALRYDAMQKLGGWMWGYHNQTWTTNSTANKYTWTGASTSTYAKAIASCKAATPVQHTNAAAPYRYTQIVRAETNWQAIAYALKAIPTVTGMATSITKHVDYYIRTTPKGAFHSEAGYVSNGYYRLPDESYDAGNAWTHTAAAFAGNIDAFADSEFRTNTGYYGWITGNDGPIIKWDYQYCIDALP